MSFSGAECGQVSSSPFTEYWGFLRPTLFSCDTQAVHVGPEGLGARGARTDMWLMLPVVL